MARKSFGAVPACQDLNARAMPRAAESGLADGMEDLQVCRENHSASETASIAAKLFMNISRSRGSGWDDSFTITVCVERFT